MEKLSWNNYGMLQPFFENRTEILKFAALPTFLIKFGYLYEIKDEILYLYRKGSMYGNKFEFLGFPPFTLNNEYKTEEEKLRDVLHEIPVILSEEELLRYKISKKDYKVTIKDLEFIYPLNNYRDLKGKKWHKWRVAFKSLQRDFTVENIFSNDIIDNSFFRVAVQNKFYPELLEVVKDWSTTNKQYAGLRLYLDDFFSLRLFDSLLTVFTNRNTENIQFFVITQKIGLNSVFICDWKSIARDISYNINKAVLLMLVDYYKEQGDNLSFNIGFGRTKELKKAKSILRPSMLRKYKVTAKRRCKKHGQQKSKKVS